MAEGYLVRRDGSGGGSHGTDGLNIWTGSSAPSDEVGVWVNSALTDYTKYIIPYGDMYTSTEWTIDNVLSPSMTYKKNACYSDGIVYIPCQTNGANLYMYSHDPISNIYTELGSGTSGYGLETTSRGTSAYDNGAIYVVSPSGNYIFAIISYDISSSTWTDVVRSSTTTGYSYIGSCIMYNESLVFAMGYTNTSNATLYCIYRYLPGSGVSTLSSVRTDVDSSTCQGNTTYNNGTFYFTSNRSDSSIRNATRSYDVVTNKWKSGYGYGFYNAYALYKDSDYLCALTMNSTNVYTLNLENGSTNQSWVVNGTLPTYFPSAWHISFVDTGTEYILYGAGTSYNNVLRYKYAPTNYESPSIIVECGTEQNRADIITGEDGTATINVHRVYENQSGTPVQVTGQVRSGSSPWTDIQL